MDFKGFQVPRTELAFEFMRAGGPGGQNVNKVNTKVRLRWNISESQALEPRIKELLLGKLGSRLNKSGELCVEAGEERSQEANKRRALERLDQIVRKALTPRKKRIATKPSRAAKQRRLDKKRRRGKKKAERGGVTEDW